MSARRNYATDYVVHAYAMGAACKQRAHDRIASEVRSDVTCKRCLASLAKRDRAFRAKASRVLRWGPPGATHVEGLVIWGAWGRWDDAERAVAREEGRAP